MKTKTLLPAFLFCILAPFTAHAGDTLINQSHTPGSELISGHSFPYYGIVQNQTTSSVYLEGFRLYLSVDSIAESTDTILNLLNIDSEEITAGNSFVEMKKYTLPDNLSQGEYYLIGQFIYSSTDINDPDTSTAVQMIEISPENIDLSLASVSSTSTLIHAGETYSIDYMFNNKGNVRAPVSETGMYLSYDEYFDATDILIEQFQQDSMDAGATRYQNQRINSFDLDTIPSGTYYIIIAVDHNDELFEANENNNLLITQLVYIKQLTPGNITLESISLPDTVKYGAEFNIIAEISTTVFISPLTVTIYLSEDDVLDRSTDSIIGFQSYFLFDPGTTIFSINEVIWDGQIDANTLSNDPYYIFLSVDEENLHPESNEDDNTMSESLYIGTHESYDLTINSCSVSRDSLIEGQNLAVQCSIQNNGTGITGLSKLGVYMSNDTIFDDADTQLDNKYIYSLKANQIQSVDAGITLGGVDPGDYYILFIADYLENIEEFDEENNLAFKPFRVIDKAAITQNDLVLDDITLPDTILPDHYYDFPIYYSYTGVADNFVKFAGYLSKDTILDPDERSNPIFNSSLKVTAMQESIGKIYLNLPTISDVGEYYIFVMADSDFDLVEDNEENNMLRQKVFINPNDLSAEVGIANLQINQVILSPKSYLTGYFIVNSMKNYITDSLQVRISLCPVDSSDEYCLLLSDDKVMLEGTQSFSSNFRVKIPETITDGIYQVKVEISLPEKYIEYGLMTNMAEQEILVKSGTVDFKIENLEVLSQPLTRYSNIEFTLDYTMLGNTVYSSPGLVYVLSDDTIASSDDVVLYHYNYIFAGLEEEKQFSSSIWFSNNILPGDYFLIATVNADSIIFESNRDNNSAIAQVHVTEDGFNYHLREMNVHPDLVVQGEEFFIECTIDNTGNITSENTEVLFYLSADKLPDQSDFLLGSKSIYEIMKGNYRTFTINVTTDNSIIPGLYYLICVVDEENLHEELNEEDNMLSETLLIHFPSYDFYFGTEPFTDTVWMQKDMEQNVSFYIINNGPSTYDGPLEAKAYLSEESQVTIGASTVQYTYPPGDYRQHLLFIEVPSSVDFGLYNSYIELDPAEKLNDVSRDNNVFSFTLGVIEKDIDIVLTHMSVSKSTIRQGESIELYETIANTGRTLATGTYYNYIFLSRDNTLDEDDYLIYIMSCPPLEGGTQKNQGTVITIHDSIPTGNYYLISKADYTNNLEETNEENNIIMTPLSIESEEADLEVTSAQVLQSAAFYGTPLNFSFTIRNSGNTDIGFAFSSAVYFSSDAVFDNEDIKIGSVSSSFSLSGDQHEFNLSATAPLSDTGTYYILFFADNQYVVKEANEENNITAVSIDMVTNEFLPEISLNKVVVKRSFDSVYVKFELANAGLNPTGQEIPLKISYTESWNYGIGGYILHSASYDAMEPGEGIPLEFTFAPPGDEYNYIFIYADPDNQIDEYEEVLNNFTRSMLYNFTADLAVIKETEQIQSLPGNTVAIASWVINKSEAIVEQTEFKVYLSADTLPDNTDSLLYSVTIAELEPFVQLYIPLEVRLPDNLSAGSHSLILIVNETSMGEEPDWMNNTSIIPLSINSAAADLSIETSLKNLYYHSGDTLTIDATVRNLSTFASSESSLKFWLSKDVLTDSADLLLGEIDLDALDANDSTSIQNTLVLPVDMAPGNYILISTVVNNGTGIEEVTTNNSAYELISILATSIGQKSVTDSDLFVFPNPARETVHVRSEKVVDQYKLINSVGKIVDEQLINTGEFDVNTGHLAPGIYLLHTLSGKTVLAKIIVIIAH